MILIVCVDDSFGMGFNHRRQSSDRVVTEEILKLSAGKKLWIAPYSASLFSMISNLCTDKDFLKKAGQGEFCFAESMDVTPYLDRAEKVILFHWNRKYPSDVKFPYDTLKSQWEAENFRVFSGRSHNKITMEVYRR